MIQRASLLAVLLAVLSLVVLTTSCSSPEPIRPSAPHGYTVDLTPDENGEGWK
jgi:predicted component of type VI protein secretion system